MSDRRHSTRPTLPGDYQYGDARPEPINPEGATFVHEGVTYVLGPPLAFNPDAFALVSEGETCAICGGAASWDSGIDRWRCRKCGARWISGIAMKPISDEEYKEKYLRPAVEHDPQGAADLVERCRALLPHGVVREDGIAFDLQTHDWLCALPYGRCTCGVDPEGLITPAQPIPESWRAQHENAAEQLKRRQPPLKCGDEGCAHWFDGRVEDYAPDHRCLCGARTWAEEMKRQADGFDIAGDVTREDRIQRTGDETV